MDGASSGKFVYLFHAGMTCEGCSNAINKLMSTESSYVDSYEIDLAGKTLKVIGGDNIDGRVMERLGKWATASKKELAFVSKTPQ